MNGLANERRRIIDVYVIYARRKVLLELGQRIPDFVLHLDETSARRGDDTEGSGIIPVRIPLGGEVQAVKLGMADVADTGDTSLGIRLYDDVAKLFGRGETSKCADIHLISVARVVEHRRLIEGTSRDLSVLTTQYVQNIAGADITRSGLVRIDPDPHRVLPLSQNPEIRDAGQARDFVSHVENEIVGDVLRAARSIRRIWMNAQQQGWDCLLDLHPLELDFLRQPGQRVLHPVVREHQCRVDVGAYLENHRDAELAITCRLAADVVHVLDAVDGLLKRCRDGARDDFGRSAWVGGRDLDGWRDDVRILSYRQECCRSKSEHHDEDTDDRGEPRVVNEEMRKFHDPTEPRFVLGVSSSGSACGDTAAPGRAVGMPRTITRSDEVRPERMTRRPSRKSPIWTILGVTTLFDATVRTMWSDWSGSTEASGTSRVSAGGATSTRTRANPPGVKRPSASGTVARAWMVPLVRSRMLSMKSRGASWGKWFSWASAIWTFSASGPPCLWRSRRNVM